MVLWWSYSPWVGSIPQLVGPKCILAASLLSTRHEGVKSAAQCLPMDCCFGEVERYKSTWARWSSTKPPSSHVKVTCSRHDLAQKYSLGLQQLSLTYNAFFFLWITYKISYYNLFKKVLHSNDFSGQNTCNYCQ